MESAEQVRQTDAWLTSIGNLTGSHADAQRWREDRYRFAHRLGEMLVGQTTIREAVSGQVVYGIWLRWGFLYVGQTNDAANTTAVVRVGGLLTCGDSGIRGRWLGVFCARWTSG